MTVRCFISSLVSGVWETGLIVLAVLLVCIAPARAEKRVALVIGNSAYVNVPRLDNPRNDARLVADTLRDLGFTIVGGGAQLDLTEQGFRQIVQDFGKELQGSDVGLFYYAGHGVQARGSNYLVPVDANPTREADVDFQMLDANLVLLQMEGAGTKLNLVILDACRNNPLSGRGLRAITSGLATMQSPEGTLISFATQPGSVAQDGNDGHSPYTEALVKTMRKPGLDIFRTFNEVGLTVDATTGGVQKPWVSLSPIRGDFYFTGPVSIDANVTVNQRLPPPDPAAQAWAVTKDTTSAAVIEDFIRQFGDTVYGSMARARLEELKKSQVATAPTALPENTPLSSSTVATGNSAFPGAVSMSECSAMYKAAKDAGVLNGMMWNDFRKAQCGVDASTTPAGTAVPAPAPTPVPLATGNAVFPSVVNPKYSNDSPDKARLETCLDQYRTNKANNANGALNWVQIGGGYYSQCNAKLKDHDIAVSSSATPSRQQECSDQATAKGLHGEERKQFRAECKKNGGTAPPQ